MPGGFEFHCGYLEDDERFRAFNDLAKSVFDVDFREWRDRGLLDRDYVPYSLFGPQGAVANASLYSLAIRIDGERRQAAQICTCATAREFRRQGLARLLLKQALLQAQQRHDFIFLFAEEEAASFYRRLGFVPASEWVPQATLRGTEASSGRIRKLCVENPADFALIVQIARDRTPVSDVIGLDNSALLLFHCLRGLRDCIHYIEELNCLLLFEEAGDRLLVYDVVAAAMPKWRDIEPFLVGRGTTTAEFLFLPDKLCVGGLQWYETNRNQLHFFRVNPFAGRRILIPFTAHA